MKVAHHGWHFVAFRMLAEDGHKVLFHVVEWRWPALVLPGWWQERAQHSAVRAGEMCLYEQGEAAREFFKKRLLVARLGHGWVLVLG